MPDYINYAVTSTMRSRLKPCYSCPASCLKKCAGKCTLRSLLRGHSLAIDDDEEIRADVITGAKDYGAYLAPQNFNTRPPEHRKLLCVESTNCVLSQSACAKRTANLGLTLTSNPPPIAQEKELSEPLKPKPSALRCAPPNRTCPKGVSLGLIGKRTIGPNRYV